MTQIEVSPESLRQAARELTGVAEDTDGTLQQFHSEIESLGMPWGDDELGMAIGVIYQGALAMVMNCFVSNLDTVEGHSQRLDLSAAGYDSADQDSSAQMTAIDTSVPDLPI